MDRKIKFSQYGSDRIAYIRPVDLADLPADMLDQADAADDLYAVHDEDGQRLALVNGRRLAFYIARQNDMSPVHVH